MPVFDTPAPISALIELGVGDLRVVASDRSDTVVEVRPTNPSKQSDITAAEQTRVEYSDGNLSIKTPKGWRQFTFRGGNESVDITIELPAGSRVQAEAGVAALHSQGPLGEARLKTGVGDIRLEEVGGAQVKTGGGDVTVDRVTGQADIATGSGAVRVGAIGASAIIKDSNGDIWVGAVSGDLRASTANGQISVERADAAVAAKSANGAIRLGQVARGEVTAQTANGSLEIGVREGVAAWLDLKTHYGTVHNSLEQTDAPAPGDATVEVRARTAFGDITIRRSSSGSGSGSGGGAGASSSQPEPRS
jgi:hypothetical protein